MNTKKKEIQKKKEKTKRRAYQCPLPFIMEYMYAKKQCRHINRAGYNNMCELIDCLRSSKQYSVIFKMRKVCKQKIRKRGLWDGSTWATTYNTGTCFSVSSDDKLVLFLFPGIPTGDPAIVAFYDKRIYKKKLRLK